MGKENILNVPIKYSTKISIVPTSIHKLNPEFSLCDVDVMYVDENRNGTDISKEVVEDATYSLYGVPIVGEWLEDEKRFGDHGEKIEITRDKITCTVTTKPIGFVTKDAVDNAEWVEKPLPNGHELKTWLRLRKCILWTGRYEEAQSIIDNGSFQSMEVKFLDGDYKENGYFKPSKMIFSALCAIGVEPCFEESNIRRAEYNLDSFKLEVQKMLDEYKKFNESDGTTATVQNNATNNNPQMEGENKMDLTRFTALLSDIKCERNNRIRYELLSADENKIYVFDKEDGYKIYSVEYVTSNDGDPVINWNTKTEGDITFAEKSEEVSHLTAIYNEINDSLSKKYADEYQVKLDEKIKEVSGEIETKYTKLQEDHETLKNSYSVVKEKLDKFEAIEAEKAKQSHIEAVKETLERFEKKIGKAPEFIYFKAKLDENYENIDLEKLDKDLTMLSGDVLMNSNSKKTFSYNPTSTNVNKYNTENDLTNRYGHLFDGFVD